MLILYLKGGGATEKGEVINTLYHYTSVMYYSGLIFGAPKILVGHMKSCDKKYCSPLGMSLSLRVVGDYPFVMGAAWEGSLLLLLLLLLLLFSKWMCLTQDL